MNQTVQTDARKDQMETAGKAMINKRDCIHCGLSMWEAAATQGKCSKAVQHRFDVPTGMGDPDCQRCGVTSEVEERQNGLWLCDDCDNDGRTEDNQSEADLYKAQRRDIEMRSRCKVCEYEAWVISAETSKVLYCAVCDARGRARDFATELREARQRRCVMCGGKQPDEEREFATDCPCGGRFMTPHGAVTYFILSLHAMQHGQKGEVLSTKTNCRQA